jgi:hypothetical protein
VSFNVMRDESRRDSFGHAHLGPLFGKIQLDDLEDCAESAFQAVSLMWRRSRGVATAADDDQARSSLRLLVEELWGVEIDGGKDILL